MYMIVYKKKRDVHVIIRNLIVSTGIYIRLRVELMLKQLNIYLSVRSSLSCLFSFPNRLIIFQWKDESSFKEPFLIVLYIFAIRGPFSLTSVAGMLC